MPANVGRGKHYCGHKQHRKPRPETEKSEPQQLIERLCQTAECTGDWQPVIQRQLELIGVAK